MGSKNWAFKVVKSARGNRGEYFDFPTAATFDSETEAREYARDFATEQARVGGARFDVRTRGNKLVARYVTRDGVLVDLKRASL
jgi:hypothetical protein